MKLYGYAGPKSKIPNGQPWGQIIDWIGSTVPVSCLSKLSPQRPCMAYAHITPIPNGADCLDRNHVNIL